MLDHIDFTVTDYQRSRNFYERALAPLGMGVVMEATREQTGGYEGCGFGPPGKPMFWVSVGSGVASSGMHVALTAAARALVEAFYAGGKHNGPPGLRPHYHPNDYGAFVIDPDGNNVEVACHSTE